MRTSAEIDQIVTALALARPHFGPIHKNQENPHFKQKYADLNAILDAVVMPLAAQGVVIAGGPEPREDGNILVRTRLMHTSGQWLEASMLIGGGKIQEQGSGITYARRYTTGALLGVAADDDDDGENASKATARAVTRQVPIVSGQATALQTHSPSGRVGKGPSHQEVDVLLKSMPEAYTDSAQTEQLIRTVMQIPVPQRYDDRRLRLTMTWAQYDQIKDAIAAQVRQSVETDPDDADDVPLSDPPDTLASSETHDHDTALPREPDAGGIVLEPDSIATVGTDGEPAIDLTIGTADQWLTLRQRAEAVKYGKSAWATLRAGSYLDAVDAVEALEDAKRGSSVEVV